MGCRLKEINWEAVATMAITGDFSLAEISRILEIPYERLKSRSKRGKWLKYRQEYLRRLDSERGPVQLVPPDSNGSRRVKLPASNDPASEQSPQLTVFQEVESGEQLGPHSENLESSGPIPVVKSSMESTEIIANGTKNHKSEGKMMEAAAANWADRQIKHRNAAFGFAHSAFMGATKGKNKLKAPRTYKDLDIVDKMARRAAGLDDDEKTSVNVLINLGALNGALRPG